MQEILEEHAHCGSSAYYGPDHTFPGLTGAAGDLQIKMGHRDWPFRLSDSTGIPTICRT
jgi:hypothetical protein